MKGTLIKLPNQQEPKETQKKGWNMGMRIRDGPLKGTLKLPEQGEAEEKLNRMRLREAPVKGTFKLQKQGEEAGTLKGGIMFSGN